MKPTNIKETLVVTKEILETHGHCQDRYYNRSSDSYCLVGAIMCSVQGHVVTSYHHIYPENKELLDSTMDYLNSYLCVDDNRYLKNIIYWNDLSTTFDVMNLLDKAIENI